MTVESPNVSYTDYKDEDIKSSVYLIDDTCHIYLNWEAASDLQLGLYGLAYNYSYYEDIEVVSCDNCFVSEDGKPVKSCTFMVIKDEDLENESIVKSGRVVYQPNNLSLPLLNRVIFYMTRGEVRSVFLNVRNAMSAGSSVYNVEVFGRMVMNIAKHR